MFTTRIVVDEVGGSQTAAGNALEALAEAGIITGAQLDKRTRAWRASDVLDLLDEFAEWMSRT
ncbi:hypothetical protein HMPREF2550_11620 [Corynebacterium sp. HMSC074A01]|nr:hypothetical protein HMPREF2550_11620 [Corynebacterium sp. HMSC074A01]